MDRRELEPMTVERAREIVASVRPKIFKDLIHSTDSMIEDAAHKGERVIVPGWRMLPRA